MTADGKMKGGGGFWEGGRGSRSAHVNDVLPHPHHVIETILDELVRIYIYIYNIIYAAAITLQTVLMKAAGDTLTERWLADHQRIKLRRRRSSPGLLSVE